MNKASDCPRVVIVGAGFGGMAAARRLAGRAADVTVIDRRNHHLFQPLLYQVATAALSPADIAAPIRSVLSRARNVRVLLDEVVGVEPGAGQVRLSSWRPAQLFRQRPVGGARSGPKEHRGCA